jgi:hypothetical protein
LASQNIHGANYPINSYGGGISTSFWESNSFSFSTTIGFIRKGGAIKFTTTNSQGNSAGNGKTITGLNYIYIAPRFAYKKSYKKWNPFVFIAPRVDFFISATEKTIINGETVSKTKNVTFYKDNHRNIVFGFNIGLGIERSITDQIAVGIEFGLWRDFTKPVVVNEPNKTNVKTRNIVLTSFASIKYLLNKN